MTVVPDLLEEVEDAYRRWTLALTDHDAAELDRIHGDRFVYTGLDGRVVSRETHIEMELAAEVQPQVVSKLRVHECGGAIVASGEHELQGEIAHEATSAYWSVFGSSTSTVAFTTVWVRSDVGLRVWSMHLDLRAPYERRHERHVGSGVWAEGEILSLRAAVLTDLSRDAGPIAKAIDRPCIVTNPGGARFGPTRIDEVGVAHLGGNVVALRTDRRDEAVLAWGSSTSFLEPSKEFAFTQLWRVDRSGLLLSSSHLSVVWPSDSLNERQAS